MDCAGERLPHPVRNVGPEGAIADGVEGNDRRVLAVSLEGDLRGHRVMKEARLRGRKAKG